jgi:nitroreductase
MTEPWGFTVLGDEARRAYARVLGGRKSKKVTDPEAARLVREKVERNTMAVPALLIVTVDQHADPEIREEDVAATWMGIQNILLGAHARGLGGHIKTGAVMNDPELRDAWRVPVARRVVATLELGEPAGEPRLTEREPATTRTTWLD